MRWLRGSSRLRQLRGSNPDARRRTTDWPPLNRLVAGSVDCRASGGVGEGGNGGCTVLPGPHCASQGYNCPLLKQHPPHLLLR